MKCPICGDEFEPKRADAKTCGKASCRKKLQRHNAQLEKDPPTIPATDKTPDTLVKDYAAPVAERPEMKSSERAWNHRLERWVVPGECKFGPCTAPDCRFGSTCKFA